MYTNINRHSFVYLHNGRVQRKKLQKEEGMSNSIALALFILSHVALRPSGQTSSPALRASLLLFIRPTLTSPPPDLVFFNLLCICATTISFGGMKAATRSRFKCHIIFVLW